MILINSGGRHRRHWQWPWRRRREDEHEGWNIVQLRVFRESVVAARERQRTARRRG